VERRKREVVERVQPFVADQDDRAAVTAVAARRAALRDVFLAPEGDAPAPAAPAADVDSGLVEELQSRCSAPARSA
jgi:hypothetical protein